MIATNTKYLSTGVAILMSLALSTIGHPIKTARQPKKRNKKTEPTALANGSTLNIAMDSRSPKMNGIILRLECLTKKFWITISNTGFCPNKFLCKT
jgi:hypothetical protein